MISISTKRFLQTIFLLFSAGLFAQQKTLKGKVINAQNGEAMAFVPVYTVDSKGDKKSTTTDFDGFYEILYESKPDSLVVKFDEFLPKSIFLQEGFSDELNLSITPIDSKKSKPKTKNIEGILIKRKK